MPILNPTFHRPSISSYSPFRLTSETAQYDPAHAMCTEMYSSHSQSCGQTLDSIHFPPANFSLSEKIRPNKFLATDDAASLGTTGSGAVLAVHYRFEAVQRSLALTAIVFETSSGQVATLVASFDAFPFSTPGTCLPLARLVPRPKLAASATAVEFEIIERESPSSWSNKISPLTGKSINFFWRRADSLLPCQKISDSRILPRRRKMSNLSLIMTLTILLYTTRIFASISSEMNFGACRNARSTILSTGRDGILEISES